MARKAPAAIVRAVRALGAWVRSPAYRGTWSQLRRAQAMANSLRRDLIYEKYREMRGAADSKEWADALTWCEADSEEVVQEVLHTLSRSVPQLPGEPPLYYEARLRTIREAFKAVP